MNKFSQLIKQGVAAFRYQFVAPQTPNQNELVREYNNTYGAASDTHMTENANGTYTITGSIFKQPYWKIESFLCCSRFAGVEFKHSTKLSLASWMHHHGLKGHFDTVNGDDVYILENMTEDELAAGFMRTGLEGRGGCTACNVDICRCCIGESRIPQNSAILSTTVNIRDIYDCVGENLVETAKRMNESKRIYGDQWMVTECTDGQHICGFVGNIFYKI